MSSRFSASSLIWPSRSLRVASGRACRRSRARSSPSRGSRRAACGNRGRSRPAACCARARFRPTRASSPSRAPATPRSSAAAVCSASVSSSARASESSGAQPLSCAMPTTPTRPRGVRSGRNSHGTIGSVAVSAPAGSSWVKAQRAAVMLAVSSASSGGQAARKIEVAVLFEQDDRRPSEAGVDLGRGAFGDLVAASRGRRACG